MFTKGRRSKQRSLPFPVNDFRVREGSRNHVGNQKWIMNPWLANYTKHLGGTQVTESEGNQWPLPKNSGNRDIGSEFFTQKKEIVSPTVMPYSFIPVQRTDLSWDYCLEGSLIANCFAVIPGDAWGTPVVPLQYSFPPDLSSSRHDLEVVGAKAIALCAPGNPIAQVSSFFGELLQDVPRIPGIALWEARLRAAATLAAGGDEVLNLLFGVAPTLGDMGGFLKAVHKADKAVNQFVRDSGRVVRRRYYFPLEKSVTSTVLPNTWSPAGWIRRPTAPFDGTNAIGAANAGAALPVRETTRTRVVERKQWFSGAFTYHVPGWFDSNSERDRRRLMAKLFGAEPDLNTLWQLAPWSWAVDWFSNAGLFVKNLQRLHDYGTVLRYGYVMETTTVTDTFTPTGPYSNVGPGVISAPYPYVAPVILRTTTKKRIAASPFGFGLDFEGFDTFQKAILTALGITRVFR